MIDGYISLLETSNLNTTSYHLEIVSPATYIFPYRSTLLQLGQPRSLLQV